MSHLAPRLLPLVCLALIGACACAWPGRVPRALRPFALDGSRCLLDPEHFGIVGGRITAGADHRDLAAINGLWAPPFVSSDFRLDVRLSGQPIPTESYMWLPFEVRRSGVAGSIALATSVVALDGRRALVLEVALRNRDRRPVEAPVELAVSGTLDRSPEWGFTRPASATPTTCRLDGSALAMEQGRPAIRVRPSGARGRWTLDGPRWGATIRLQPSRTARLYVTVTVGEAQAAARECAEVANAPARAVSMTRAAWSRRAEELFRRLPRFEADDPRLVAFYNRSLVHLLTNRWDVPEFVLRPYYSTGSVKGGCVCNYLWNYGEVWEILPLFDAAAARAHILQFLKCDISRHFAFDPVTGAAFGPWYPVNQEKIIGSIYHYVAETGDRGFLDETVSGKTVLDWVLFHATVLDDPGQPVRLVDYGPSNSHLELRRGYPYNHVMPDLNGRRYQSYLWAERLSEIAGKRAPWLGDRARQLRSVLRRELWDSEARWFSFIRGDGKRDLRYTIQVFKLLGSGVLDDGEERGLLSHLNEKEFLSEFGFHSMSKADPAYDQVDIDNGGGGACTCFPPQVIEKLYRAGHPDMAADILRRILWWGERLPYWGDSIVANEMNYRRDTPLQCTLDGATGAQAIIFGMFGVRVEADGSIVVNPHPPAFSPRIALKGLRIRGRRMDVEVSGTGYRVTCGNRTWRREAGSGVTRVR